MLNNLLFLPVTDYFFFFYLLTADVCALEEKPAQPVDTIIVPTVVGCVLAGLIVILIITYFVGRCKTPAGYQHM